MFALVTWLHALGMLVVLSLLGLIAWMVWDFATAPTIDPPRYDSQHHRKTDIKE